MAFRVGLPAECGVIPAALAGTDPAADNQRVLEAIASRADWEGHFSVIATDRVRMRPMKKLGKERPNETTPDQDQSSKDREQTASE